jgi:hypothetical protein
MVTELEVTDDDVTAVITGAGAADVAKVKFAEVASVPAEFADRTA